MNTTAEIMAKRREIETEVRNHLRVNGWMIKIRGMEAFYVHPKAIGTFSSYGALETQSRWEAEDAAARPEYDPEPTWSALVQALQTLQHMRVHPAHVLAFLHATDAYEAQKEENRGFCARGKDGDIETVEVCGNVGMIGDAILQLANGQIERFTKDGTLQERPL